MTSGLLSTFAAGLASGFGSGCKTLGSARPIGVGTGDGRAPVPAAGRCSGGVAGGCAGGVLPPVDPDVGVPPVGAGAGVVPVTVVVDAVVPFGIVALGLRRE